MQKVKKKYMKMASYSNLKIWSPLEPKTHPGPKNGLKMAEGSQKWTSCGLTNMFWPKKINFETVTLNLVLLAWNCPVVE